jgi:preprotein translocase subunit Sec61beta
MIETSLTVSPTCNAALEQCGVPIVSAVRLVNRGAEPRVGGRLRVLLGPDLGEPFEVALPTLHGGEALDLGPLDLRLPAGRLRSLVEAEPGQLQWWVRGPDDAVWAEGSAPISLLAHNEWPGLRAPPALLAAFVLPNHPALQPLLVDVRDRLGAATGDSAIDGYQSRASARARAQVEALYAAVQGLGLSYVGAPASFEGVGQKVRLPDRLLADQMGNCLDLTLLFAAAAEQMRLAPLLVVVFGHAFPGVWLEDDRFPEGTVDDAARLRNLIELGQIVVFDSSTAIAAGQPTFAQAAAAARAYLADDARFVCAIDVRVARLDRFRPLALRAAVAELGPEGAAPLPIAEGAPPELLPSAPPPSEPVALRFKRWKDRLLDLSLRNRLLNFRPTTAGSLPLRVPDLARFEDLLAGETVFEIHSAPATDPRDQRDAALLAARTDLADLQARSRADLDRGLLQVDLGPADFKRRAVDLDRAARADLEEGGANTLFAAVGLLRWFESAEAKEPRLAPLLLVPVRLEYDRRGQRIRLRRTEGEPIGNVTLAEKMSRDFALDLSFLGQLGGDERGVDVAALLQSTRQAISRVPRWEVSEEVHLGLFTFTRFLMWKDLEDNAAALLTNEVVRHIAAGGADPFPDPVGPVDPTTLDAEVPPETLPTVVDCDSTQMSAVVAARRGRSFVLQGPPGTGKSQTITNLIAAALHAGQTVLFVS